MTRTEVDRDTVSLTVNGERVQLSAGSTVADLLRRLELHPQTVVVERNGSILRDRGAYGSERLGEGDVIELVHFVGGG